MARWWLLVLVACGHPAPAPPVTPAAPSPTVLRLRAPPALDPSVRGAAYLSAVALQVQPGWSQFLDDCRLRLAATHPLNDLSLAATVELAVDAHGQIGDVKVTTSGNADFDRAVRDALRDANPLPVPPRELWSDDDRVHLAWLFARDRRQAGPATARVIDVDLPLEGVVARLVRERDLARAGKRIARAAAGQDRDAATRVLAIAALREGLEASDGTVRRMAVDAIRRAGATELAPDVRALLAASSDVDLRAAAAATLAELHDDKAAPVLLELLAHDASENEQLARAEVTALLALHHEAEVTAFLRGALLGGKDPNPITLAVSGLVALPDVTARLAGWLGSKNARMRAATCSALASVGPADATKLLTKGMSDRDASVRAACALAVRDPASVRGKLRALAKDRDVATRAAALAQLAKLPDETVHVVDDASAQVRAAFAAAASPDHPDLGALRADRDADVRAAAWQTSARGDTAAVKREAADAADDPSPQVRRALVPLLSDDTLTAIAHADVDADVRTDALVQYAAHRGRASVGDTLLANFAASPAGTLERVRTMLAWLLAR